MMKKIKYFFTSLVMLAFTVLLTSSVPTGVASLPEKPAAVQQAENPAKKAYETTAVSPGNAKAPKFTYKQLKAIATQIKGEKLTLKEKIGLKLFGKKIANKLSGSAKYDGGGKSQIIAAILCWVVGILGIHRFYLGYTWQGIVQLLTLGGCGIWALVDFIRILTGNLQPKDSEYAVTF